ncbi:hypothetical protein V6N13_065201 [Hibiscus sabdariffa]
MTRIVVLVHSVWLWNIWHSHARPVSCWVKLREVWLKYNVDSACFKDEGCTGFAAVIPDGMGCAVQCLLGHNSLILEPVLAEAFAIREALSWPHDWIWIPLLSNLIVYRVD